MGDAKFTRWGGQRLRIPYWELVSDHGVSAKTLMIFSVSLFGLAEIHNFRLRQKGSDYMIVYPVSQEGGKTLTVRKEVLQEIKDMAISLYSQSAEGYQGDNPFLYYWLEGNDIP